jgi:hypothetical protein
MPHNRSDNSFDQKANALAHAKEGYMNAQAVIRFIDTKCSVVTGLVTLSLGIPWVVVRWLAEQKPGDLLNLQDITARSPFYCTVALALVVLGGGAGLLSLVNALNGLQARRPAAKGRVTILFPMYDKNKQGSAARRSISRLGRGLNTREILREYQRQLLRVGQILHEKIDHLRRAVRYFQIEFFFYLASFGVLFLGQIT